MGPGFTGDRQWVVHIAPCWCTSTPYTVVVVYNVAWVNPDRHTDLHRGGYAPPTVCPLWTQGPYCDPLVWFKGTLCIVFQSLVQKILVNPVFLGKKTYMKFIFCSGHLGVSKKTYVKLMWIVYNSKKWCTMRHMVQKCPYFLIQWCTNASEEVQTDSDTYGPIVQFARAHPSPN